MDAEERHGPTSQIISPKEHDVTGTGKGKGRRTESLSDALPCSAPVSPAAGSDGRFSFQRPSRQSSSSSHSVALKSRPPMPQGTRPYSQTPIPLTHDEAVLVHHYTEYLGRWLDCTDATRQFTLGVPRKVKLCPVLCHAVLSFAARHRKEEAAAEAAYQRCIALLIDRLNEDAASHDETLLCAIVILRFYEQLSGKLVHALFSTHLFSDICFDANAFKSPPTPAPTTRTISPGPQPSSAPPRVTTTSTRPHPRSAKPRFGSMSASASTWLLSTNKPPTSTSLYNSILSRRPCMTHIR